jgi:predicted metal-dependent hydrolase
MRKLIINTSTGPLEYSIAHRPRVTKRLHMELDERGSLVVVAPSQWSKAYIGSTLTENVCRVERFLIRARQQKRQTLSFSNGEQHLYLGQRYPLVLIPGTKRKASVSFDDREIRVEIREHETEAIRLALQGWYLKQAFSVFSLRLETIAASADWVGERPITLKLRRMKRTWGNCSSIGIIKLNTHLIKAPMTIVDSVIAHELCHLKVMNHSKHFYALLDQLNPDWRQHRAWLRAQGSVCLL